MAIGKWHVALATSGSPYPSCSTLSLWLVKSSCLIQRMAEVSHEVEIHMLMDLPLSLPVHITQFLYSLLLSTYSSFFTLSSFLGM